VNDTGRVILLNGASSVGKTSLARALQAITEEPYLHLALDGFLASLPRATFNTPEGLTFRPARPNGTPEVVVEIGPTAARALRGMRRAIAAMGREGNNLIVDDVMLDGAAADYRECLAGLDVTWIAVVAPLETLEARERARGDRDLGLARWQHQRVHDGIAYDLTLDTTLATPEQCAALIKQTFDL
jgi:chloramphenicol 3-O phosphotransferase